MKKLIRLNKNTIKYEYKKDILGLNVLSGKDLDVGILYIVHYIDNTNEYEVYANDKYIGDQGIIEIQIL